MHLSQPFQVAHTLYSFSWAFSLPSAHLAQRTCTGISPVLTTPSFSLATQHHSPPLLDLSIWGRPPSHWQPPRLPRQCLAQGPALTHSGLSTRRALRVGKSSWVRVMPPAPPPTCWQTLCSSTVNSPDPGWVRSANLIPFKGGRQSPDKEKCSQAWALRKWREAAPVTTPRGHQI